MPQAMVSAAFILQLIAAARASFLPHFKTFWALSVLPFSALVFLVYTLLWLFNNSLWPGESENRPRPGHP